MEGFFRLKNRILAAVLLGMPVPFAFGSATPAIPPPTYGAVPYGPDRANLLDVWLVPGREAPTPVVIFFHSGAWRGGSRREVATEGLREFLDAGIAVVAVDYRFVDQAIEEGIVPPVRAPMMDCARAVQYVRHMADTWGLEKKRIAFAGRSAGACTALWLGMHPDMADASSSDLVLRESTRPFCIGVVDAQTSLDPRDMRAWFGDGAQYGGHAFGLEKNPDETPKDAFARFEAARDELLPLIQQYSPISFVSGNAPPMFLFYDLPPPGNGVHGAEFGLKLQQRLRDAGACCEISWPAKNPTPGMNQKTFIIERLSAGPE
ncbi:MAG: alpha/beta hydrolase [Kiritimatiellales bacterium]|nr:alpha/beta hydrolase [Kiritimatiellales bacterium]